MPTISPFYKQKNVANPYYTVVKSVNDDVVKKSGVKEPLYRCVEKGKGKLLLDNKGKFIFQIYVDKKELNLYIMLRKKDIVGHLGMKSRKDTTASSNVNEILSVFFLINKYKKSNYLEKLESDVAKLGDKKTGVLKPDKDSMIEITYDDLSELIDKDETAERDIKIGYQNSIAIAKDIKDKKPLNVYWCARGKPPGVSAKNPSDVVVELKKKDYQGYSNKISEGKDKTPKFNTNINAYYNKLGDEKQVKATQKLTDDAWKEAVKKLPSNKKVVKSALQKFDIKKEPYTETGSTDKFGNLGNVFRLAKMNFYAEDFYYPFRNGVIKKLATHLKKEENLKYFLNTVFFYTFEDPRVKSTPCPYKLLIGREDGSVLKEVSSDDTLKNVVSVKDKKQLSNISFEYNNTGQSFKMKFKWKKVKVIMPVTCRTRADGGWRGKSLFIETSGLKIEK